VKYVIGRPGTGTMVSAPISVLTTAFGSRPENGNEFAASVPGGNEPRHRLRTGPRAAGGGLVTTSRRVALSDRAS
jgi:hypothetical protein